MIKFYKTHSNNHITKLSHTKQRISIVDKDEVALGSSKNSNSIRNLGYCRMWKGTLQLPSTHQETLENSDVYNTSKKFKTLL